MNQITRYVNFRSLLKKYTLEKFFQSNSSTKNKRRHQNRYLLHHVSRETFESYMHNSLR